VSAEEADPKAEERLQVILAVLSGRLTATEGAQELNVSRKTYYEWQERAILAMREALRDRPGGRPSTPTDPEKEALQQALADLEKDRQILTGRLRVQEAIQEVLDQLPAKPVGSKKKP